MRDDDWSILENFLEEMKLKELKEAKEEASINEERDSDVT